MRRARERGNDAGPWWMKWDGRDDLGASLRGGVYLYRVGLDGRTVGRNKAVRMR